MSEGRWNFVDFVIPERSATQNINALIFLSKNPIIFDASRMALPNDLCRGLIALRAMCLVANRPAKHLLSPIIGAGPLVPARRWCPQCATIII